MKRNNNFFLRIGLVAAIGIGSIWAALALNVDQTRTLAFREFSTQQTAYYRLTINYNDPNIGTAQAFGRLKQNTFVRAIDCHVTTAFNAGSSNTVTLGTSSTNANELTLPTGVTAGTAGYYSITGTNTRGVAVTSDADHNLYAKYAQTGTAATAGQAVCVIEFIPNNDN